MIVSFLYFYRFFLHLYGGVKKSKNVDVLDSQSAEFKNKNSIYKNIFQNFKLDNSKYSHKLHFVELHDVDLYYELHNKKNLKFTIHFFIF